MSVVEITIVSLTLWLCVSSTQLQEDVDAQPENFWKGSARFGFDLLQALQPTIVKDSQDANGSPINCNEYQNTLISPFSISSALALVYAGSPANSTTSSQMTKTLHYPTHLEQFQKPSDLAQHIIQQQHDLNKSKDVEIANRVYVNQKYQINDDIVDVLGKDSFESLNVEQNEIAAQEINEWIAKQTRNKIQDVISSSAIDQNTFAVIVNVCVKFVILYSSDYVL